MAASRAGATAGLPTRFRPRRARLVLFPAAAILFAGFLFGALIAPAAGGYRWPDRVAISAVGALGALFLLHLARLRIVADADGVTVVNVVQRRRLEWAEIVAVRQPPGEAWLILDLSDGTALQAMAIQSADGDYAKQEALRFARLVAARTRTDRDD